MPSIINGLFSGRPGIASHGMAIAVVGDNISNASTIGYKAGRSEFEDLIAGGQTAGRVIGSGSSISAVTNIFDRGTLEFTGRDLDLAIDGNGFFVVSDNGQRSYTRAGNFKIDASGYIVDQKGNRVQGFPQGGSGALEDISVSSASQGSVETSEVTAAGNLDAKSTNTVTGVEGSGGARPIPTTTAEPPTVTYAQLSERAAFSTVVTVFDSLGSSRTVTMYFFRNEDSDLRRYYVRAYVNNEEVDSAPSTTGMPRALGAGVTLDFDVDGSLLAPDTAKFTATAQWNNGSDPTQAIEFKFPNFTQYSTSSGITSLTQDGNGIGAITSLQIDRNGQIFAMLDSGQSPIIGVIGMANFSNPEGLVRVGANLLQESKESGAPIIGRPGTGTFGSVESGSIELSTVDIASEFVKLITLQRGFQANSRIITTINQLLNEIIQLA